MNLALIQTTAGTAGRGLKIDPCISPKLKMCAVCSAMSNSLQSHDCSPIRLLCAWDFSRQEYWSGLPFPTPGDLPDPGIKPPSLAPPTLADRFFTTSATWEAHISLQELKFWLYSVVSKERNHLGLFWWH